MVARLEDLPKYCPRLFGDAAFGDREAIIRILGQYIDVEDFAAGNSFLFFRSSGYNSLYAFELAAKSIVGERNERLQALECQKKRLQAWKAEVQSSFGKVGTRVQELPKPPASATSHSSCSDRLPSGDLLVDQRLQSKSSEGVHLNRSRPGSSRFVEESSECSQSLSAASYADFAKSLDASARAWQSCPVLLETEDDLRDTPLRPSLSLGFFPSSSKLLALKGVEGPAELRRMCQSIDLTSKEPVPLNGAGCTTSVEKEACTETDAGVKIDNSSSSVEQVPLSAAGDSTPAAQQVMVVQPKKPSFPSSQIHSNGGDSRKNSLRATDQQTGHAEKSGDKVFQGANKKSEEFQKGSCGKVQSKTAQPANESPPVENGYLVRDGALVESEGGEVDKDCPDYSQNGSREAGSEVNSETSSRPLGKGENTGAHSSFSMEAGPQPQMNKSLAAGTAEIEGVTSEAKRSPDDSVKVQVAAQKTPPPPLVLATKQPEQATCGPSCTPTEAVLPYEHSGDGKNCKPE